MIVGGKWVGLGLGDDDPEVGRLKDYMRKKFRSYAGQLAHTNLFDEQMVAVVMEMQRRYNIPVTGILGYNAKVTMGYIIPPPPVKPTLLTLNGAGVSMWDGPPADCARAVENICYWQPVGFNASPFPMAPGVKQARNELRFQIDRHPGKFGLVAYSMGAIAASQVYKYDLAPDNGVLHHRLPDLRKAVMFGNPMRQNGVVWDVDGNPASPGTQGISSDRLENTPPWWREIAHHKDIYTENTVDDAGEDKTAIYGIVMNNWFSGPDSIFSQVFEVVARPIPETIAMIKAITSGIRFAASGTGPHINYPVEQAINYLRA